MKLCAHCGQADAGPTVLCAWTRMAVPALLQGVSHLAEAARVCWGWATPGSWHSFWRNGLLRQSQGMSHSEER